MRHKWAKVGGMKENPGVWDTGNGSLIYVERCEHCGLVRRHGFVYAIGRGKDWGPKYFIGPYTGPWASNGDSKPTKFQRCHFKD